MYYKKAKLTVGDKKYIYSVSGEDYCIKIIVYLFENKTPYFVAYFSYMEAWGFDVYAPKTIEILIRFYNENKEGLCENEFKTKDYPQLFSLLLEHYFADSSEQEREEFARRVWETD